MWRLICFSLLWMPAMLLAQAPDSVSVTDLVEASRRYLKDRDLDGDGTADDIHFSFSGGAHCCYSLSLQLSSQKKSIAFPFEMDGGYVFGMVDGSQPEHFRVADLDGDGREEIFMEISTYNGEKFPIPKKWTRRYGIRCNHILIDYFEGDIRLLDFAK